MCTLHSLICTNCKELARKYIKNWSLRILGTLPTGTRWSQIRFLMLWGFVLFYEYGSRYTVYALIGLKRIQGETPHCNVIMLIIICVMPHSGSCQLWSDIFVGTCQFHLMQCTCTDRQSYAPWRVPSLQVCLSSGSPRSLTPYLVWFPFSITTKVELLGRGAVCVQILYWATEAHHAGLFFQ